MDSYILHTWMLPGGCNVNSTTYTYCAVLSAKASPNGTGAHSMFLAYSNSIDVGWCLYSTSGCTNGSSTIPGGVPTTTQPTPVISGAPTLFGGATNTQMNTPSLPAILQVGNVNYMIVPGSSGSSFGWQLWASAVGDGMNWQFVGQITPTGTVTGNWDANAGIIDPGIYKNKCGNLEIYDTAFLAGAYQGLTGSSKSQAIGVSVATDIRGPYYHSNGPGAAWRGPSPTMTQTGGVFPFNSNIYNGQQFAGESNAWDDHQLFFWSGNTDNGNAFSSGVGAYMRDACQ